MSASNDPDTSYVFISYASADRERIEPVTAALRAAGVRVWIDRDDIAGGAVYAPRIVDGIEGCTAFLLMCSVASLSSPNVRQEIALAWKYQRPYLPLLLEPTTIPRDVEYWLEGAQWIEVLDHARESWLPRILDAIYKLGMEIDPPALTASTITSPPTSRAPIFSIPAPLTALVGRQSAIGEIAELLQSSRLLTLTGPGGTGKTRLAIAVGHTAAAQFPAGVMFVSMAAIRDPDLVIPAVAYALGIRESADEPIRTTLARVIGEQHLLLVLDNLEQVIDAAEDISALLVSCSRLHIIATSRSPLHISGEREYLVEPLPIPEPGAGNDIHGLADNAAISLFVDRARAVKRDFALTHDNIAAVVAICRRLDGLPLAIELAAARIKLMTPRAILTRLERPLAMLTGGARDLPERQQTIRSTIEWSYELLSGDEQRLFRQLSVFVGGWSLDAAEAVGASNDVDVLDGLLSLVEKSLVTQVEQPDGEARFNMLVTIREFGLEQLAAHAETTAAHGALVAYFLELSDEADLNSESEVALTFWLDRIERELDNLRTALTWAIEYDENSTFRLLFGVWHLWYTRGHMSDGRRFLHQALDRWPGVPTISRAQALNQVGTLATWQGDNDRAKELHAEALRLSRAIDDTSGVAQALFALGRATSFTGDVSRGRDLYEQSLLLAREIGDGHLIESVAGNLSSAYTVLGDFDRALELNDEALALARDNRSILGAQILTLNRAAMMQARGDNREATRLFAESLRLALRIGIRRFIADLIDYLGVLAGIEGDREREARLYGASQQARHTINYGLLAVFFPDIEPRLSTLRQELGDERFATLVAEGAAMTTDDAIQLALQDTGDGPTS
jgi:predicted ATPase